MHMVMLKFWVIISIISVALAFSTIVLGYSALDFMATAILLLISTYVVLRFVLSIYFGVELKPLLSIEFRHLYSSVLNGVNISILSIAIDSILSLIRLGFIQSTILSIIVTTIILYIVYRYSRLKGRLIVLTSSVILTSILYLLGYIRELAIT